MPGIATFPSSARLDMVIRHHAWGCLRAPQSHSVQPFSGRTRQGRPDLHTLPQTLRADNMGSPVLTVPWGQKISHLHAAGWASTSLLRAENY